MCSNFLLLLPSLGSFRISFVYVYVNFSIDVCVSSKSKTHGEKCAFLNASSTHADSPCF